ncbi:hypothetical protein E2C01_008738 [Portunus trituberculatus]|uniref:Uncharacterized protein n=1 Tax=Portunus trituberculatus TaxID=210409 RepID=A0A5B7D5L0_PORTR|nr:hypothetical protein [Portunus trituberculatus]
MASFTTWHPASLQGQLDSNVTLTARKLKGSSVDATTMITSGAIHLKLPGCFVMFSSKMFRTNLDSPKSATRARH